MAFSDLFFSLLSDADMATLTALGNSARGATWVALHNGGGVGWGEVTNCGFGLVLDGTEAAAKRAATMLAWDVDNGVCLLPSILLFLLFCVGAVRCPSRLLYCVCVLHHWTPPTLIVYR